MAGNLRALLAQYGEYAQNMRDKGAYFERLALAFIQYDPVMAGQFDDVWLYADWAHIMGMDGRDTGIDAVAKLRGKEEYCAIQCKFYRTGYAIQKGDIDSFLSSSQKRHFSSAMVIETTGAGWSEHASNALSDLHNPVNIITLQSLENSPINWDKWRFEEADKVALSPKKILYPRQKEALDKSVAGLARADRGKLIMACGTGKTLTGLRIAETLAGRGKMAMVFVPSLALMSQTIREWSNDSVIPLRSFAVCSDGHVGKKSAYGDADIARMEVSDLEIAATTEAQILAEAVKQDAPDHMTVIFATYHSIAVLSEAQQKYGMAESDIIICDEAHRTTGATLSGEEDSYFVRVHDQKYIQAKKRLYMTATPRVYGERAQDRASDENITLASMDDPEIYGKTLDIISFSWAVDHGFLTDYKVLVLAVDQDMVTSSVLKRLDDGENGLKIDDAGKIIGCYKALTKLGLQEQLSGDTAPMQRALAFCRDIASSKMVRDEFAHVVDEYLESEAGQEAMEDVAHLPCELNHVDGTYHARKRNEMLSWLKDSHGDKNCRILTNARCLSEGVDVPALDAILFMHPRNSQVDVVQSVGRVMRTAQGKTKGYVILPIVLPSGTSASEILNNNRNYRVIWDVLNALRSHDERLDADINRADLGEDISDRIEVVAVSNNLPATAIAKKGVDIGKGGHTKHSDAGNEKEQLAFNLEEINNAIIAQIVKKCGTRDFWQNWAGDIAQIADTHIDRISKLIEKKDSPERAAFDDFHKEICDDLNPAISEADAVEMLAQHMITRPVFDALFQDYHFARHNPVSQALQKVLDVLDTHSLDKERDTLNRFYESVQRRAKRLQTAEARQKVIVELYDNFFSKAFPRLKDKMGIVYTPIEVVDFIIHSINDLLGREFGSSLGDKGVHILDPFTGTGSFITRMLQSGLIAQEQLPHKYAHEIHANEIILLAYYIAAVNIEAVYHGIMGGEYAAFPGICLTDSFQLYEDGGDLYSDILADNSSRLTRQKELTDIRVIMGNPPYSVGQGSENDNAKNIKYPILDESIRNSYVAKSGAVLSRNSYDSYIRAIRWASDRLGDKGVVGFVTNGGWIENKSSVGLRTCLAEEYASIYIFHLRGDINKNIQTGGASKEGDNIFDSGSKTGIAICFLVKNPERAAQEHGRIFFHDIGDDLSLTQKKAIIRDLGSLSAIDELGWQEIEPDSYGDWLNHRDSSFENHIILGDNRGRESATIFSFYSQGVNSSRDAWVYNFSREKLKQNIDRLITNFNAEVTRYAEAGRPDDFELANDKTHINWSRALKNDLEKERLIDADEGEYRIALYRPFCKSHFYMSRRLNEVVSRTSQFMPYDGVENRAIAMVGTGQNGRLAC